MQPIKRYNVFDSPNTLRTAKSVWGQGGTVKKRKEARLRSNASHLKLNCVIALRQLGELFAKDVRTFSKRILFAFIHAMFAFDRSETMKYFILIWMAKCKMAE